MLGEFGAGERLADAVVADVGNPAQAVEQAERLQDAGVNADADVSVSGLNPLQCRPGREGPLGHDRHRQPPAPTGIVDVCAELAQGAPHGSRNAYGGLMLPSPRGDAGETRDIGNRGSPISRAGGKR